jgi:hypothetical protein
LIEAARPELDQNAFLEQAGRGKGTRKGKFN